MADDATLLNSIVAKHATIWTPRLMTMGLRLGLSARLFVWDYDLHSARKILFWVQGHYWQHLTSKCYNYSCESLKNQVLLIGLFFLFVAQADIDFVWTIYVDNANKYGILLEVVQVLTDIF
jgi:hypothetical protein